jgi:YVTN family beta-propeller protein
MCNVARLAILLLSAIGLARAQWLEAILPLPDSTSGMCDPQVAFCDDNNGLVYVGGGNGILVVDAAAGEGAWRIHFGASFGTMCADSFGQKVYCGTPNSITVLDAARHEPLTVIRRDCHNDALTFNPATNCIYWSGENPESLFVIDCLSDVVVAAIPVGWRPTSHALNPSRNVLYCANELDNTISVIDCATNTCVRTLPAGGTRLYDLEYNAARGKLYCACHDSHCVSVFDGATDSLLTVVSAGSWPYRLALDSAADRLFCADDDTVTVIDCSADTVVARIHVGYWTSKMACDPVRHRVYCGHFSDDLLSVIDSERDSIVAVARTGEGPYGIAVSRNSGLVVLADRESDELTFYRPQNDSCWTRKVGAWLYDMATDADQGRVFAADADGYVIAVDPGTSRAASLIAVGSRATALGYNPADNKLYAGSYTAGREVVVVDCAAEVVDTTLSIFPGVSLFVWSATSDRMYCAGWDSAYVTAIDGASSAVLARIRISGAAKQMVWGPPGDVVFCAYSGIYPNADGIAVIDCATNAVVDTLATGGYPMGLALNPRTNRLYCASSSDSIWVYDAAARTLLTKTNIGDGQRDVLCDTLRNRIYCLSGPTQRVVAIDGATSRVLYSVLTGFSPDTVVLDEVNNKLYCSDKYRDSVAVVDCATHRVLERLPAGKWVGKLLWLRRFGRVYAACEGDAQLAVFADSIPSGIADFANATAARAVASHPGRWLGVTEKGDLLDATGRHVAAVARGRLDLAAFAPGVYFLRQGATHRPAKIVIAH